MIKYVNQMINLILQITKMINLKHSYKIKTINLKNLTYLLINNKIKQKNQKNQKQTAKIRITKQLNQQITLTCGKVNFRNSKKHQMTYQNIKIYVNNKKENQTYNNNKLTGQIEIQKIQYRKVIIIKLKLMSLKCKLYKKYNQRLNQKNKKIKILYKEKIFNYQMIKSSKNTNKMKTLLIKLKNQKTQIVIQIHFKKNLKTKKIKQKNLINFQMKKWVKHMNYSYNVKKQNFKKAKLKYKSKRLPNLTKKLINQINKYSIITKNKSNKGTNYQIYKNNYIKHKNMNKNPKIQILNYV
ncbi:hypothetical protein IMG5_150800, partial [Ichthyophthirius multifiliis]